jgi:hypothetical protein
MKRGERVLEEVVQHAFVIEEGGERGCKWQFPQVLEMAMVVEVGTQQVNQSFPDQVLGRLADGRPVVTAEREEITLKKDTP